VGSHKYIVLVTAALVAGGMMFGIISAAAGLPAVVWALMCAVALCGISVLTFQWIQTLRSVEAMREALSRTTPAKIAIRANSMVKPLETSFNKFVAEHKDRFEGVERENSEIGLQLQLLQRQKRNTEAIIYSIRDSVVVVDAFDRVTLANAAAEQLFGFKFDKDSSPSIEELIDNEDFVKLIVKSRRSKIPHVRHEVTFAREGEERVYDCIISCVKDEDGLISGVVAVMHDMTKEKEISQMKNDFVSHVSHELKTPLAAINGYAEMLVDGEAEDQETVKEFCTIIQSQAQRLNRLIDDILNISRIESGLTKVTKEALSLAILVKDATEAIASYAAEKNITINTPAGIIFDQALADKDMITQVIINLLSNAVKYTPGGGSVDVKVDVDQVEDVVRVTVSDTGVGIPAEDVEHVFDKFFRVEANMKQAKGTGLGLNLVKQIIEKVHEGSVFVTSVQGEGSTFGFTLPLAAERAATTV
jgi:two-component system phosphate regulon sensor histidine kinase PhoR